MTHSSLAGWPAFLSEVRHLGPGTAAGAEPQGIPAAARPFLLAALAGQTGHPLLVIAPDDNRADQMVQEIRLWLGHHEETAARVHYFARPDARAYERIPWTGQTRHSRLTALVALLQPDAGSCIVVSSVDALMQKTIPPAQLRDALHRYRIGGTHRISRILEDWVAGGYIRRNLVESAGTFAHRGSILDIWPANLLHPVRFDFFGDDIETLRVFDPQSQRSTAQLQSVLIGPASEARARQGPVLLERVGLPQGTVNAPDAAVQNPALRGPLQDPELQLFLQQDIAAEVGHLRRQESFSTIEWYLPYMYEPPGCLLDYLGAEGWLLLDDGADCEQALKTAEHAGIELRTELLRSGDLPAHFASSWFSYDEMLERITACRPLLLGYGDLEGRSMGTAQGVGRHIRALDLQQQTQTARPAAVAETAAEGASVLVVSQMKATVMDMLAEAGLTVEPIEVPGLTDRPIPGRIQVLEGMVHGGFSIMDPAGTAPLWQVISDTEFFDLQKIYRRRHTRTHQSVTPEQFFAEVSQGDHVVHVDFGIGAYAGLVTRNLRGVDVEYIQVDFRDGDKVYVPVHQADRVSRYVGAEDPLLSKLGSSRWTTAKAKVRREVEDIAQELIKIHAARERTDGVPVGPDDTMQQALELSFPFDETPDQVQAIQDVKADLEMARHMDRLIVGDVGFGKTEVAIRAASKMVLDGRQVAVLAPTTVLTHQHHATFAERMRTLPVHVDVLSRLRSAADRRSVKEALAAGKVDIVIGTHALLAKDVRFRNLGLLIIDEEQRFGVRQKERIKKLKPSVNVLTMSATPIPRTMNMGLSGIRDISYIATPPEERLPVHTVSAPFDATLVRKALERELRRDGQAFVVSDRIRGIVGLADEIARLAPGASIDIAHGRMKGDDLEDAMMRFAKARTDILVCTTIIENGLDIPNANTMIINNADRFGMAQLYQLRGRVGRSYKRGHCYLLFSAERHLSFPARTRLQNIVEASDELGAGFRIAMSDLQLRGAGEILGARQSGSMGAVGLELYTRMLANEVAALQQDRDGARPGRAAPAAAVLPKADLLAPSVTLLLPLEARIPDWYIEDNATRYRFYHRIAGLRNEEEAAEFRQELIDRFGSISPQVDAVPEEIENLLYQIQVKQAAERAEVEAIAHRPPHLLIKPRADIETERHLLAAHLRRTLATLHQDLPAFAPAPYRVGRDGIYLSLQDNDFWQEMLIQMLEGLVQYRQQTHRLPGTAGIAV